MEDAIATLPAGLKSKITPELDFMAMISTLEGTFGSRSESFFTPYCKHASHGKAGWKGTRTRAKADAEKEVAEHEKANKDHDADVSFSGDSAASLGIHQWAMDKDTAGGGGSLVEFFKTLQSRAKAAEAKKAEDRTEEEAIYVEAWGQCTTAGLTIVGGKLQINGKDATGLEVEDALAGPMATGGLRKYQVIMIAEELEELWAKPVVPGMWGSQMIGNKYTASSPSKDATFSTDKYTIKLARRPRWPRSARSAPTSGMKMAVANIFPNRPGWMGALVWRSLLAGDPQAHAADLVAKIVKAEDAKPPPAEAKKEPEAQPDPKKKPGEGQGARETRAHGGHGGRQAGVQGPPGARLAVGRQGRPGQTAGRLQRDGPAVLQGRGREDPARQRLEVSTRRRRRRPAQAPLRLEVALGAAGERRRRELARRQRCLRALGGQAGSAQDEAGERQHYQHADDRRQDAAEVEHVVVADPEQVGEQEQPTAAPTRPRTSETSHDAGPPMWGRRRRASGAGR